MPVTRKTERELQQVLLRWYDSKTALFGAAALRLVSNGLTFILLRGALEYLKDAEDEDVLIVKSQHGSFVNVAGWIRGRSVEIKKDWRGIAIIVTFDDGMVAVADYEGVAELLEGAGHPVPSHSRREKGHRSPRAAALRRRARW